MAVFPASGKHRCISGEKSFVIQLGTGTSVTMSLHGKMNGLLAGNPVSGFGSLEYTYVQGASQWVRTEIGGSAIGPASIPVTLANNIALVYDPTGRCNAKVSIETDSDVAPESVGFKFKNKKQVWKMKGRTELLTITVVQSIGSNTCVLDDAVVAPVCGTAPLDTFEEIAGWCATNHPGCSPDYCSSLVQATCGLEAV